MILEKKINYYDRAAEAKPEPVAKKARRATEWLRGETMKDYAAKLQAGGVAVTQGRMYMAYESVAMESKLKHATDLKKAYAGLYRSLPSEVQKLLRPGNLSNVQTMKDIPHYSYGPLAEMVVTYEDGSKALLQLAASNFPAKVIPGQEGMNFRDVPKPRDGVVVRSQYFCVARKIDPLTGKPGDLDPNFTKDGVAFTPKNARELVEKVIEVGRNSIRAERAHRLKLAQDENLAAGWSMRKPVDLRAINMEAGIKQGNVIRPEFRGHQEKPAPGVKHEQEHTYKRAM